MRILFIAEYIVDVSQEMLSPIFLNKYKYRLLHLF